MTTKHRAISLATIAFARDGVAGTSLDGLARQLGVTKQTVLYHFGSKEGLVKSVFAEAAKTLTHELQQATKHSEIGWPRIVAIVRTSFRLALRRPELLGLLREIDRMGPPWSSEVVSAFESLASGAVDHLESGMRSGHYRQTDPRLVLFTSYSAVTGMVLDSEGLRVLGLELDLRVATRFRSTVLAFLYSVLIDEDRPAPVQLGKDRDLPSRPV